MSKLMPTLLSPLGRTMLATGLILGLACQLMFQPAAVAEETAKPTPREYSPSDPSAPIPRSTIVVSDTGQPQETQIPSTSSIGQDILKRAPNNNGTPLGTPIPPTSRIYGAAAQTAPVQQKTLPETSRQPKPIRPTTSDTQNSAPAPVPYAPSSLVGPVPGFATQKPASVLQGAPASKPVVTPTVANMPSTSVLTTDRPVSAPATTEPVTTDPGVTEPTPPEAIEPTPTPIETAPVPESIEPVGPTEPAPPVAQEAVQPVEETSDAPTPAAEPTPEPNSLPQHEEVPPDAPEPSPRATALKTMKEERVPRIPKINHEDVVPSTFRDVEPGVTNLATLFEAWGEPVEQTGDEKEGSYVYEIDPFESVEVLTTEGVVTSILIRLKGVISPEELAERLQLDFIRTAEVRDEQGQALGRAFPERGVLFSYDPAAVEPQVAQILLETIDPQAFSLRAESFWRSQSAASLADVAFVLEHQPEADNAWHLQSKIYLRLGQVDIALESAKKACELVPEEQDYALTRAQCLAQAGDYEEARQMAEAVIDSENVTTLTKSRALLLLGNLLAEGTQRDYKGAIENHLEAIKLAEPLAVDPLVATRLSAKEILLEATLSVARDIAWGNWNRKEEVVPKWVERADAYARDAIQKDGAGVELRIQVIERALSAHTGFKPAVDPGRFLEVATELTRQLTDGTEDPLARQAAEWELGRIYNHAVRLAHLRGQVDQGLKYGETAQLKLEEAAVGRQSSAHARNELGRLYFHLGVLHAVHKQDHEKAVEWYDRAHALLLPKAGQTTEEPGQLGEMLISMGVSYWQVDLKQKGLELTTQGAKFVKQAVDQGTLAPSSLTVPYSNLASMHEELGHPEKAKEISRTAEQLNQSQRK